ncbi:hypothetical protein BKA82DRAFT_4104677 [Pisolithus tinctorius]|nr:hypothetical protein BKA82DRAFT_4104677 [Pisolithus tinctorius]
MSNPEFTHSPPPYELSLQNDPKISQSLQQDELKKAPVTDDKHVDWEQTKEHPPVQHSLPVEISVRPLRIQKRAPASVYGGTRGPRPLPPCPTNSKTQCIHGKEIPRLKMVMEGKVHEEYTEEHLPPAPPPFAPVGPSLDGPPYEDVSATPLTTSSLSERFGPSFNGSRRRRGSHPSQLPSALTDPPNEPPSRSGYSAVQGAARETRVQSRTRGSRLAFDPSVAYAHDHQYGCVGESRAVDAMSLYSHAVSSHIQHSPANSGSRYPHMSANRSSTRPFSSNFDSRVRSTAGPMSLQFTPALSIGPSVSTHSLNHSPPTMDARCSSRRWAASEYDITTHIYRD